MMHVEIDDGHTAQASHIQGVASGHRHVIDETKPHGVVARRMMTGWPNGAKGVAQASVDHSVSGGHSGPGRSPHGRPSPRTGPGVWVERPGVTGFLQLTQEIIQGEDVVEVVCQRQIRLRDQWDLLRNHQGIQALSPQLVFNGADSLRALGVARPHFVRQTIGM